MWKGEREGQREWESDICIQYIDIHLFSLFVFYILNQIYKRLQLIIVVLILSHLLFVLSFCFRLTKCRNDQSQDDDKSNK